MRGYASGIEQNFLQPAAVAGGQAQVSFGNAVSQAYQDFVTSRPIGERVFKVSREHGTSRPVLPAGPAPKPFMPLDSLTIIGR